MGRHLTRVVASALMLLATGVVGAAAQTPMPPFPAAATKVASGTWNGAVWTLFAGEFISATSFSHCINVVVGPNSAHKGGGGCSGGGLRKAGELLPTSPPAPGFSYGMTYGGSSDCPTFFVFEGLIVANARQVAITLSTGKTVTTPTIASPPGLAQSLRFWATHIPCGTNPTGMVGRDAAGRVIARMDSRLLPHTPTG